MSQLRGEGKEGGTQIGGRMYLVDKRITPDPHDLLSVHTTTYLLQYARPTRTQREAWLRLAVKERCISGTGTPTVTLLEKTRVLRRECPGDKRR